MNVLFLGRRDSPILSYLRGRHTDVGWSAERLPNDPAFYTYDWYVSHGYRYIITPEQLEGRRFVNCHISYLPWNRGASPNAWSWYDDSPKGVTLHFMDAGVDTGPIITLRKVAFGKGETLATSYARLQAEMFSLFCEKWQGIIDGEIRPFTSSFAGTYHYTAETERIITPLLTDGWATPVSVLVDAGRKARDKGNP